MPNPDTFYTPAKAAEKFGVDRRTINRWVRSGKLKAIVTPGGHSRIFSSELDAKLQRHMNLQPAPKGKTTILIVDDDASVRKTLEKKLTREGYAVETAADGFNAGLKVRGIRPQLIVLDLMMDGIDGFEVCRSIKADDVLKDTKILIMTGFDTRENRERALREGADDYLPKSSSLSHVLKHIDALLPQ